MIRVLPRRVIARTRLFATQYQEWHITNNNQRTLVNTVTFWADKVHVMKKYDRLTGNIGRGEEYGMAVSNGDDANEEVIEYYIRSVNTALVTERNTPTTITTTIISHQSTSAAGDAH